MHRLGRYELMELLGEGGDGRVHRAVLRGPGGLRKPVALKVLRQGASALRREARIGGLLRHPNLVDVYEVGRDEDQWFCALELCEGTLEDHVPLPASAVVEVGLAVCAALRYAHEQLSLVHLDLKPSNLLVAADGTVKVSDLGIARADGFDADPGVRGTPGYMAPEQALGASVDARADIYALGVTLRELATGRAPVATDTLDLGSLDDPAVEVADAPEVPGWLAPLVARCVAEDPADRFPSMSALAAALRGLEVEGPGLAELLDLPPPAAAPAPGSPERWNDAFVGRHTELADLADALRRGRSIAVKGSAGIGKSRLAAAAAAEWQETGGQAWCCDLSAAHSEHGLLSAVAGTLGLELGGDDSAARVGHALAGRGAAVLVLDNFDHLRAYATHLQQWRDASPATRLVVTSRVDLPLGGMQTLELQPLDEDAAVELLVVRARQRGVEVPRDAATRELARRLDGLPLCLELAAGRLGVLSVDDVLEHFGLDLLRRGTQGRHATLRAALAWSWDLLSVSERSALAQLSVFSGGFTLDAAEEVLALPSGTVLDAVTTLVEHSLVGARPAERFDLLSSVRSFAADQLEDAPAARRRHGAHYARLCVQWLDAIEEHGGSEARRAVAADLDNLVEACRDAVDRHDGATAAATLAGAWVAWERRGPYAPAAALAPAVCGLPGLTDGQAALAEGTLGAILMRQGDPRAADARLRSALEAARRCGDPRGQTRILVHLAIARRLLGQLDAAWEATHAAVGLARAAGSRYREAVVLGGLGNIHAARGQLSAARTAYETARTLSRAVGARNLEATLANNLGNVATEQGRMVEAAELYRASLDAAHAAGDRRGEGTARCNAALLHLRLSDFLRAFADHRAARDIARELGDRRWEASIEANIGETHRICGELDLAGACLDQAIEMHRALGVLPKLAYDLGERGRVHCDLEELDAARTCLEEGLALALEVGDRRGEGVVRGHLAVLERRAGRPDAARAQHDAAVVAYREVGDPRGIGRELGHAAVLAGDLERAQRMLDEAEPLVRRAADPAALALHHAQRAEVCLRAGDRAAAHASLARARQVLPPTHASARSAVERVARIVSEADAASPVIRPPLDPLAQERPVPRHPQAPLPSGFGRDTPASAVIAGIDLTGRIAVVTGGYSGIGVETTRALAGAGATVWVPVRNRAKADATLAGVQGDVRMSDMDLTDLGSVRAFAAHVRGEHDAVHILINNAGVMACPETRIGPGWEAQFATNHLAHFELTRSLLPALRGAGGARVVALSSSAHRISDIRWDDVHFTAEPYDKWQAYGQSKTANALFAVGLDAREASHSIRAFAVHPGGIQTPLQRHLPVEEMAALGWVDADGALTPQAAAMFKSVEAGAATAVWCATSPQLDGIGGVFCEDCDISAPAGDTPYVGVHPHAVDPASADRLWSLTETMLAQLAS